MDYKQVAVLMAVGMIANVLFEIPSGAVADIIGKKPTLVVSALLYGAGTLIQGTSQSYSLILFSSVLTFGGLAFLSGALEAYMYDSLACMGKEKDYSHVISRVEVVSNLAILIASVVGGFLFNIQPGLPFLVTSAFSLMALISGLFLIEPEIDSKKYKFSVREVLKQSRISFEHVFSKKIRSLSLLIILLGTFTVFLYELLDDVIVIEVGYDSVGIGVLYAITVLLSIGAATIYPRIKIKFGEVSIILVGTVLQIIYMFITPFSGLIIWTGLFLLRVVYSPLRNSAISEIINKNTNSTIRATTLSVYELLKKIPYLILAFPIGSLVDDYTAIKSIWIFGVFYIILLLLLIPKIKEMKKLEDSF